MSEVKNPPETGRFENVLQFWPVVVGIGLIVAHGWLTGWTLGQAPFRSPEFLGAFGDFVGGILNPVVAFSALYWLIRSVKIQKQELAETKAELAKQAKSSSDSVHLAALTAVVNGDYARIDSLRANMLSFEKELNNRNLDRSQPYFAQLQKMHTQCHEEILELEGEVLRHLLALKAYLPNSAQRPRV